jgi:hypothetical protein
MFGYASFRIVLRGRKKGGRRGRKGGRNKHSGPIKPLKIFGKYV